MQQDPILQRSLRLVLVAYRLTPATHHKGNMVAMPVGAIILSRYSRTWVTQCHTLTVRGVEVGYATQSMALQLDKSCTSPASAWLRKMHSTK